MWLIFCETTDVVGLWAFLGLKKLGLEPIQIILPEELVLGTEYFHRLSSRQVDIELKLKSGQHITKNQISGVFNRLFEIPRKYLEQIREDDRDYILEEFHAFFMSWMNSLTCPVLNPPGAFYLCGEWYNLSEWLSLASRVGLPATPYTMSSHYEANQVFSEDNTRPNQKRKALVIGHNVIAPGAPQAIALGCHNLASLVALPVLGLDFVITPNNEWRFCGASPIPDLRIGGNQALAALAQVLKSYE